MIDLFHRLSLRIDRLKQQKSKNTYIYLFFIMLIITVLFSAIYIKSKRDRDVKENIIESLMAEVVQEEDANSGTEADRAPIIVYICGAVADPGVYAVGKEDRVIDLLKMAGGARHDAYTQALNLAKKLSDGEKVYVPTYGEASGSAYDGEWQKENNTVRTVNINTASAEELAMLPGIGVSIAAAIVSHREANGFFESIEELKAVKGIGEKKFEELKDLIVH